MNAFLKHTLPKFATQNPSIEITVSPRPHRHPVVVGHYVNGQSRTVEVRNLEKLEILKKVAALRDANGEKERRVRGPVGSTNESVRGVWSGVHGSGICLGEEVKGRRD
jgi:large subunit ribosomal protein L43